MSIQGMLHCVSGAMFTMSQIPEQFQHLERKEQTISLPTQCMHYLASHDALLVILSKVPNKIQQFITLLLACPNPAALKAAKQVVKLFW